MLAQETYLSPLRKWDCCPISDGASAVIIATVDKAKEWGVPYAVISGIDHRIETHNLGMRDLTDSVNTMASNLTDQVRSISSAAIDSMRAS